MAEIKEYLDKVGLATYDTEIKSYVKKSSNLTNYYTKTQVDNKISGLSGSSDPVDLSNYYTITETNNKISSEIASAGHTTASEISGIVGTTLAGQLASTDLSSPASKSYVQDEITKVNTNGSIDTSNIISLKKLGEKSLLPEDLGYSTKTDLDTWKSKAKENIDTVSLKDLGAKDLKATDFGYNPSSSLNDWQKKARENIGAASVGEAYDYMSDRFVPFGPRVFSDEASKAILQQTARENIGAAAEADVIKISAQTLSAAQQEQARNNIGALGFKDSNSEEDLEPYGSALGRNYARSKIMAVSYDDAVVVPLTTEQKAQARTNIGINTIQKEIVLSHGTKPNNWAGITSKFAVASISGISDTSGSYNRTTTEEYLPDMHLAVVPLTSGVINFCVHYNAYTAVDLYVRLNILCID